MVNSILNEKEREVVILYDSLEILNDSVNNYRSKLCGDIDSAEIRLDSEDSHKMFILNILELTKQSGFIENPS